MSWLRKRLEKLADDGESFPRLLAELDRNRDGLPVVEYDALWLFCWALVRRQPGAHGSPVWSAVRWDELLSPAEG